MTFLEVEEEVQQADVIWQNGNVLLKKNLCFLKLAAGGLQRNKKSCLNNKGVAER